MTQSPWKVTILTLFPEIFPGPLKYSVMGKALEKNLWQLNTINIRDFAQDKHKTVDDTPYGGGAGMVMKPDVIHRALEQACENYKEKPRVVYLTPRGVLFKQTIAHDLVSNSRQGLIILCGRYEGVDQRVIEHWQMEEISVGDFILSAGEIGALTVLDACLRLIPGVLGKEESWQNESFQLGLLEHSLYTKPYEWNGKVVPDVLRSGDHQQIAAWQRNNAVEVTKQRRPDLWEGYQKAHNQKSEP